MRKIISKEKRERKSKKNATIAAFILIFVMLFSILGYSFSGRDESEAKKINYKGFEFINQNDFWFLNLEGFQFVFKYNPNEVEKVDTELNSLDSYVGLPLYIYSESSEAELEIYRNLFERTQITQRIQRACLEDRECNENVPIKTCSDNFIIIDKGSEVKITQEDNCTFIEGPEENLTQITDEFLFKILGID